MKQQVIPNGVWVPQLSYIWVPSHDYFSPIWNHFKITYSFAIFSSYFILAL